MADTVGAERQVDSIRKVIGFGEALAEWLETPDKDRGQSAAYMAAELRHVIALLTSEGERYGSRGCGE